MDLDQLRQFIAITQSGSIKSAAEKFYISRPAISKSIARLESEAGFPLFVRKTSGVVLTPAGSQLLPYAQAVVNTFDRLKQEMDKLGNEKHFLRIGFTYGVLSLFDEALEQYQRDHPTARIEIYAVKAEDIASWLRSERVDLCCGDVVLNEDGIDECPVREERILYAVPPESEMARRGFITDEEMANHCIMGPNSGKRSSFIYETPQGERQRKTMNADYFSSDDMLFLFSRVKQGHGILAMPELLAKNYTVSDIVFVPSEKTKYWEIRTYYLHKSHAIITELLGAVFADRGYQL